MNFQRWRPVRTTSKQQLRKQNEKRRRGYVARQYEHLLFEPLEWRQLLTVTLAPIAGSDANDDFNVPSGKALYVPLTGVDVGNTVSYSASSANPNVKLDVIDGNPTLVLNISGTRSDGQAFTGQLTIDLFDDLAPVTVDRISSLAEAGTYNGKSFYRIIQDFMIQGGLQGSPSQTNIVDEFNALLTMNSPGLIAMANPGNPDLNTSEIFITDIDRPTAETPQYLNFRHTIFGQLTSGFDTYQDIMNAMGITPSNSTPNPAVIITSASIIEAGDQSAVLRVLVPNDFTGTAEITVTANSSDSSMASQTFGINAAPQGAATDKIPIVIAPVTDKTTTVGNAISFQVTAQTQGTLPLVYPVSGTNGFRGTPANVTVLVTPGANNTATITLTPAAGFNGTIDLVLHADNDANNLHDVMSFKLNVVAAVTIDDFTDPVNIAADGKASISGKGEEGTTIEVEIEDEDGTTITQTTTVDENGDWEINDIDVSSLDDGEITYTATDTTNDTTPDTATAVLDLTTPTVTIVTIATINNGNATAVTVSGTGEPGSTVKVKAANGANETAEFTATVNGSGNWTVNVNVSTLGDGSLTFTATATDAGENTAMDTETAAKDTTAPLVDIDTATNPVTISNVTTASIEGTAEPGATIKLIVTDGTNSTTEVTTTADSSGDWSFSNVNLTALNDGQITYRVTASDAVGNEATDTLTASKAVLAVTAFTNPINISNVNNASISGTGAIGADIEVVISDSDGGPTITRTTTVDDQGNWSITGIGLSTLTDGTITFTITATDDDENEVELTRTANKDTVAPVVSINPIGTVVNIGNEDDFSVTGTITGTGNTATTIRLEVNDANGSTPAVVRTITVNADGTWSINDLDLSDLDDGTLTFTVRATDAAQNESATDTENGTKDTTAPTITVGNFTNPVNPTNETAASINGTAPGATTVTVVVIDRNGNESDPVTVNVTAGTNAWSVTNLDLSDLLDGDLIYQITATDANGNETTVERDAEKSTADNSIRGIAYVDRNGNGRFDSGDAVLRNVMIQLHGVDGQNNPVPSKSIRTGSDGSYRFNDLPPGTYTIREVQPSNFSSHSTNVGSHGGKRGTNFVSGIELDGGDDARNYNFGERGLTSSNITIMDFLASTPSYQARYDQATSKGHTANPVVGSIKLLSDNPTSATTVRFEIRFNKDVTGVNSTDFRIVKTGSITGDSINPVITGSGKRYVVTVNTGSGSGKIGLAVRDDNTIRTPGGKFLGGAGASNGDFVSRYYTVSKAPTAGITVVTPSTINASNDNNVTISGTGTAGATISVVASNGSSTTPARTTTVGSNGQWSITGYDVTSLPDGTITFTATATNSSGTSTPATRTATKDATAPALAISTVTNPINNGNRTTVSISGTGEAGRTVSVVASNGSSSTTASTATVAANGTWTINNIDVTSLPDGTIVFTATSTDAAGNTATDTENSTKDATAPAVAITSVTEPINNGNKATVDVSGTGEVGRTVSVVVSDGTNTTTARTAVVAANGTWSINDIDVTSLDDGTITFTATITDAAGNTGTDTEEVEKDVVAPALTIATIGPVNSANEQTVDISGTGEAGRTVSVVVSDGTNSTAARTAVVAANGTWTIDDIDVSSLDDGTLTFTATSTDAAGNTTTDTETAIKDTIAPTVTINDVDDLIDDSEDEAVDVGGTVTGAATGTVITVTINDTNDATPAVEAEVTVNADGTWDIDDIDVSSLDDGTLTFTVVATDAAGNASAPDSDTTTKDATTPTVTLDQPATINDEGQNAVDVGGTISNTTAATTTIKVVINDDNDATPAIEEEVTVDADGTWSINDIDVSSLDDGTLTFTVTATDAAGNSSTDTKTAMKDTVTVLDITSATDPINGANAATTTVAGTGEAGATVTVVATDGVMTLPGVTGTVDENGMWSIVVDVSSLADGTITFTATAVDGAGNPATPDTETSLKDTVDPALDLTSITDPINIANHDAVEASGTGEVGATISVVASDGTNSTAAVTTTVDGSGNWSITGIDLAGLDDGTITFTATATDGAGNTSSDSMTATKTTVAITAVTDPINDAGKTNVSISGTGQIGATVTVVVSDGVNPEISLPSVVIDGSGNWSITGIDVSSLDDGTITFSATADASGDTAVKTKTATKDTVAPAVAVTTVTDPINTANGANTTASGTAEPGASITLFVTDAVLTTIIYNTTADENGEWSISNIDVSALSDGMLAYVATATDAAGNTSAETQKLASKDTIAPVVDVTSVTAEIDFDNHKNGSASGTVEVGSTVKVTATDGVTTTEPVDAIVDGSGNWTATGIDVSGLVDGTITFTATATDAAGNTATDSLDGVKSTVLITSVTDPIVPTNDDATTASGTGHPGATIKVKASNGDVESAEYTTVVAEDGTWTIENIDVSSLPDGTITYTAIATLGEETATSTKTAIKDSMPPDLTINELPQFINAAGATNASISGTTEPGATVTVTVTDGPTTIGPFSAVVEADGTWSLTGIDVSSLSDSTLTFTVTARDANDNDNQLSRTSTLDTVAPSVTIDDSTDPVTSANATTASAGGTTGAGSTVTVVVTDGVTSTASVTDVADIDGFWTVTGIDVSALADGTITYTVFSTDPAGNASSTVTVNAAKDTTVPLVTIDAPAVINLANETSITVSGTGEVGATITLVISDGSLPNITPAATVVDGSGNWSIAGIDVSSLDDGTIIFTATGADGSGNTSQDTAMATMDTVLPNLFLVSATDPITPVNEQTATLHGIAGDDDIVTVIVTDGVNSTSAYPATVDPINNEWTISNIDVSGLADGLISFMATSTDAAGNVRTENLVAMKKPVGVASVTEPINATNAANTSISGKVRAGNTVKVVASDGTDSTVEYVATIDGSGNWSVAGIDVSALDDGSIIYTITATDGSDNTSSVTRVVTKDTEAPSVMSVARADTNPTSAQTVQFTVVFTEPVTGVGASTFQTVPGGTVSGVSIDEVTGSGTTYTVTASFTAGTGTLGLNVDDVDAVFDSANNPLGGLGLDNGDFTGPEYTIV